MHLEQLGEIKVRIAAVTLVALGLALPTLSAMSSTRDQAVTATPTDAKSPRISLGALGIPWADLNDHRLPPLSLRLPPDAASTPPMPDTASARAIPSLFDRRATASQGAWTFQIGVWLPYSRVLMGQDVTVNAGVGTVIDENGNLLGFAYYDGTPSNSPALEETPLPTRAVPTKK